jgi:hemolysin activation/secretion protein
MMSIKPTRTWNTCALFGLGLFSLPLQAQVNLDAGSLLRDIESSLKPSPSLPPMLEDVPAPLEDEGIRITLSQVNVSGAEGLLTVDEINAITQPFIGQMLGFNGVKRIADALTQAIKAKGYFLSYAYLPKQKMRGGVLEVQVLPGRVDGDVQIDYLDNDEQPINIKPAQVEGVLQYALGDTANALLQAKRIEQAVLTLNDFAGIGAGLNLEKGRQLGSTKVTLDLNSTPRYSGVFWLDNYGGWYTGRERGNAMASIHNLSGRGDQLTGLVSASLNQAYGRIHYITPLGYSGLKLQTAYTHLNYALAESLKSQNMTGQSQVFNLGAIYPLYRSKQANLWAEINWDHKVMADEIAGEETRNRAFQNLTLTYRGDSLDRWLGGGANAFQADLTLGELKRSKADDLQADLDTFNTTGRFSKLELNVSRQQKLTQNWLLFMQGRAQFTPDNLDSAEKFSISGSSAVRAYAPGESAGDEGWFASVEARYTLPAAKSDGAKLELKAFWDAGQVTLSKNGYADYEPANNNKVNQHQLQGYGFGMTVTHPSNKEFSFFWAHQYQDEVNDRTTTGLDSEEQSDNYRVGLQFKAWF